MSNGIGGIMIITIQKIIEFSWGLIGGAMTIGIIYGVKTGRVSIWFFSAMILIYTLYGDALFD